MKIDVTKRVIEGDLTGQTLGMKLDNSSSMLFQILRDKMYSDPIGSVIREISSNARDANREAGTESTPIQIFLPNNTSPYLAIKDSGRGLSPERMDKVYRWYGRSTKREDDTQTGGFGLGAKTPFALTDSFTVTTINEGIKYEWVAYIDESGCGAIKLTSHHKTDEPSGTAIRIPIPRDKFYECKEKAIYFTQLWNPPPNMPGLGATLKAKEILYSGTNWCIFTENIDFMYIVDGIPYPNTSNKIRSDIPNLALVFNTGDLSLSASREDLTYDDDTVAAVQQRLKIVVDELKIEFQKKIDACETLTDAILFLQQVHSNNYKLYSKLFNNNHLQNFTYKKEVIQFPIKTKEVYKREKCTYRKNWNQYDWEGTLPDENKTLIVFNDRPIPVLKPGFELPKRLTTTDVSYINKKAAEHGVSSVLLIDENAEDNISLLKELFDQKHGFITYPLSEIKFKKVIAKKNTVLHYYDPATGDSKKINLLDNTEKFAYTVSSYVDRTYINCTELGYTFISIKPDYEPRIKDNPLFVPIDDLKKSIPELEHSKIVEATNYRRIHSEYINKKELIDEARLDNADYKVDPNIKYPILKKYEKYIESLGFSKPSYYGSHSYNDFFSSKLIDKYPLLGYIGSYDMSNSKTKKYVLEYIQLMNGANNV